MRSSQHGGAVGPEHAPGLDLLRALAILAVMLYHLSSHGIALPAVVEHGWMGVDLFFVLSGYLIGWQLLRYYALGTTPPWRRFMLGRALRILPAYYTVLALYVLLPDGREGGQLQPLWKYLSFTVNIAPDWGQGRAYSHAWSLCVEEHFYLLFPPVLWLLARRVRASQVVLLALGMVAGAMLLRSWLWHAQVAPWLDGGDAGAAMRSFAALIYNPTYARLDGLLAGVLLAALRAFRPHWWTRLARHGGYLLAAGTAILACGMRVPLFGPTGATLLFPLIALGAACLVAGAASPATVLGRRALPGARALALLAFSLYLTHKQVYTWLDGAFPGLGAHAPAVALALYGAVSLAAAGLLHVGIERPFLRLRRRWLDRPAALPAVDPARASPR